MKHFEEYFIDWNVAFVGVKNNWISPKGFLTHYDFNKSSKYNLDDDFISFVFSNYEITNNEFLKILKETFKFSDKEEACEIWQLIFFSEIINSKNFINQKLIEYYEKIKIFLCTLLPCFLYSLYYVIAKIVLRLVIPNINSVVVLDINNQVPNKSKFVSKIQIGSFLPYLSLYENYDSLIISAKKKAFKIGGNILKITSHTPYQYNIGRSEITLHKIKAEVYYFANTDSLRNIENKTGVGDKKTRLNFYMFYQGLATKSIYVNDSLITKLKSKTKYTYYPNKEGVMSVKCGKKGIPISINVLKGKNYYLKCNIKLGLIKNTTFIDKKDSIIGAKEFNFF